MTEQNALATRTLEQQQALERQLFATDDTGKRALVIPPELRENFNVLAPAAVLTQHGGYFEPSFTVVYLDPDPDAGDFYPIEKNRDGTPKKLSMTKDAILKLANAAGIDFSHDPGGCEEGEAIAVYIFGQKVMEARRYVYRAQGRIRAIDGTLKAFSAEKEWHPAKEALEKETEASGKSYLKTEQDKLTYAKKEFLRSLDFRTMMTKSKAQNAVMRSAFGIKQKYTPAEAAKPFFIVSHAFSPDASDPQTVAMVASLIGADTANLYGARSTAPALGEAKPYEPEPEDVTDIESEAADEDAGEAEIVEAEIVEDGGDEGGLFPEGDAFANVPTPPTLAEAQSYVFSDGTFAGSSIEQIVRMEGGKEWLEKVQDYFHELSKEGKLSDKQAVAMRHLDAYYLHTEGVI